MNETNLILKAVAQKALESDTIRVDGREGGPGHRITVVSGQPVACTCKGFHFTGKCWALTQMKALAENVKGD